MVVSRIAPAIDGARLQSSTNTVGRHTKLHKVAFGWNVAVVCNVSPTIDVVVGINSTGKITRGHNPIVDS